MPERTSLSETCLFGGPLVRLYRVALHRDPVPRELEMGLQKLREGTPLRQVASAVINTKEFETLHGPASAPSADLLSGLVSSVLPGAKEHKATLEMLSAATELGADLAEVIALLAELPLLRSSLPLLPGLAPGVPADDDTAYRLWVAAYDCALAETGMAPSESQGPCVHIFMNAGDSTIEDALRSADSFARQSHSNWRLHLSAGSISSWPAAALTDACAEDPRLIVAVPTDMEWPPRVAESGFACFMEPGDRLAPSAFREMLAAFEARPDLAIVYSDEDVGDGEFRNSPRFKPDFSPDLMLVGNFIGQLAMYRSEILAHVERPLAAPHAAYHLAMRAVALVGSDRVGHVPAMLFHRATPAVDWPATGTAPQRKAPGLVAIEKPGTSEWPRLRFAIPDPPPLVSVLILTRDRADLLEACVTSVLERTDYPALELVIVDNGSTDPQALELLDGLSEREGVRVLRRPEPFNFAALNNAAAAVAAGEVFLLLNNDVEVLHPDWLGEMVSHAMRPGVGAVGAKLLYPDRSVQHAGLLLGPAGTATHVGRYASPDDAGYDGQLACTRDLSAVTGACLAMRRGVFEQVGGMEERLAVAWNDVDLCLRVRAAGLRVVWTPNAVLTHRELSTRGREALDLNKLARFRTEQALMREIWGKALDEDPFLNPNLLASETGPLVLARPRRSGL
jgi:GT2 family glycosyltransferase